MESVREIFDTIRNTTPLVHFITNYVTVNDCANITLACGGAPIMADEIGEVAQITALGSALVLNTGTICERTKESMLKAGQYANANGIPVILDPAGVGVSDYRNSAVQLLLREIDFAVIKGNISEIKFLSHEIVSTRGVDAVETDLVNAENLEENCMFARKLAAMTGAVIVITGPIDIVTDNNRTYTVYNGHMTMTKITGTGCMSAALLGCAVGAYQEEVLEASVTAVAVMGVCGELAYEKMTEKKAGLGSFKNYLIDAMGNINGATLLKKSKIGDVR